MYMYTYIYISITKKLPRPFGVSRRRFGGVWPQPCALGATGAGDQQLPGPGEGGPRSKAYRSYVGVIQLPYGSKYISNTYFGA